MNIKDAAFIAYVQPTSLEDTIDDLTQGNDDYYDWVNTINEQDQAEVLATLESKPFNVSMAAVSNFIANHHRKLS